MARRRTQRVKITSSLITGVIAVAAVALLGFALLSKKAPFKLPVPTPPATVSPQAPTPPPAGETPTPGLPVKKLPDTAGEPFSYAVKQNDSLYGIGMTFCDDKAAWVYLAEENNLTEPYILHKGDTLTISCP